MERADFIRPLIMLTLPPGRFLPLVGLSDKITDLESGALRLDAP